MKKITLSKSTHAHNDFLDNLIIAGKRQSNAETKSHWNKFKTFCQLAKLPSPDSWKMDDFTADIIGKHACWLITEGKSGKPLSSYRLCISGLRTHLENKFSESKNRSQMAHGLVFKYKKIEK